MAIDITGQTISSWNSFMQLCNTEFTDRWHFRGVLDNWALETALERAARDWRIPMNDLPEIEKGLLREFKRAYPPDESTLSPDDNDTLGWMALMQHHGAPTRLLDWTYSPFVAAFFALDALLSCGEFERKAAVWALSYRPLASAGGLRALSEVLSFLPKSFPAAMVVVQHLDQRHRSLMADILSRRTALKVKQPIEPGTVYIATPNRHLLVNPDRTLSLSQSELVHFVRPSADLLFESAAASYKDRANRCGPDRFG